MAPWASERGLMLLSQTVRQYCHPGALSQITAHDTKRIPYYSPSYHSTCSFASGSMIYGRVMVDPVQNLGDSFSCSIEKVFLCTGADGYVPKYNPTNKEYGCLADASTLLYRFKILVRWDRTTLWVVLSKPNELVLIPDFCVCCSAGQGPARHSSFSVWRCGF